MRTDLKTRISARKVLKVLDLAIFKNRLGSFAKTTSIRLVKGFGSRNREKSSMKRRRLALNESRFFEATKKPRIGK